MDFHRLEQNIMDNIYEAQIKLGYDYHAVSLNYTIHQLNNLLGTDLSPEELKTVLEEFINYSDVPGDIGIARYSRGYCLTISAEGAAFVHKKYPHEGFLPELIDILRRHDITFEDVFDVFRNYSDSVCIEKSSDEEFEWLVYFRDGDPDSYRYCFASEECIDGGCHISYHRFTQEDYRDLRL